MKTLRMTCMLLITAVLLLGCATTRTIKNASLPGNETEKEMLIEPFESVGVSQTGAMKRGDITVIQGVFPDILFGEYYPGRIRWNAWIVSEEDGREFFGQSIFSGIDYSGHFLETIIIDGKVTRAKVIILSTLANYVYDLAGNEISIDRKKFLLNEDDYRQKIVLKKGTPIGDMKKASGFHEMLKQWNRYQTPNGILLSPLGEEEIRLIAGINPQYSFSEKLVGSGRFSISMDPIATAVGIGIDIFRASNGSVPSTGWDYNSQLPSRRNMALIIQYVSKMKQGLIDNINNVNMMKLVTEKR